MDESHARELLAAADAGAVRTLAALGAEIGSITAARQDANSDDEHDPEGTTLAYERSQADALRKAAEIRRSEIADALSRLDAGEYGRCVRCGQPIADGRLEARPWAALCVADAAREGERR
ncbi:MAG TPA: TraR/DksA C4-type zinc finger protein [Naasia sp.]